MGDRRFSTAQAASGDELIATAALDTLYRRHWSELCRYLRRLVGQGPPEPEDIAQTAFIRFAQQSSHQDVRNPRAFLFRTARNLVVDAKRRERRFTGIASDVGILEQDRRDSGAESVIASRQDVERIDAIIQTLPPNDRIAMRMYIVDELSFAEIARQLEVSPAGARKFVLRALAACMDALEGE